MSPPLPHSRNIHRSGNIWLHGGHLLCPVIRTSSESSNTGSALQRETERRITPETSGETTVNSIRCLHIGQGAGNVILHPLQVFILDKEDDKKMEVKREMLPSAAQNHTWAAELELQWEHEGDTDWVWVRGLDCAVRLTLTCSQLHAFSCQKTMTVGILGRSRREETCQSLPYRSSQKRWIPRSPRHQSRRSEEWKRTCGEYTD